MKLDDLTSRQCAWLQTNDRDSDVAVSTRIRLARNIAGYSFVSRASDADLQSIVEEAKTARVALFPSGEVEFVEFDASSREDANFLFERRHVGRGFVESRRPRALALHSSESFSVALNDEDHIRIRATSPGFDLQSAWKTVDAVDAAIDANFDCAFDAQYGYLTASPANVGTGLRASVMLHLPALIETREASRAWRSLQKLNLVVRGVFGEGYRPVGDFFLVSNQRTLGLSESSILEQMHDVVSSVVEYERRARETILERNRKSMTDRCFRALGILASARALSFDEALARLSLVRLGIQMNLIENAPLAVVDDLMLHIQPTHLRRLAEAQGVVERDDETLRARYARHKLKSLNL